MLALAKQSLCQQLEDGVILRGRELPAVLSAGVRAMEGAMIIEVSALGISELMEELRTWWINKKCCNCLSKPLVEFWEFVWDFDDEGQTLFFWQSQLQLVFLSLHQLEIQQLLLFRALRFSRLGLLGPRSFPFRLHEASSQDRRRCYFNIVRERPQIIQ